MAALRIPYNTLVLVGDGGKALFFRNHGDEDHLNLVVERVVEAEDGGEDRGRGDADMVHEDGPDTTFAHQLAQSLYKDAHAGKYDRLVIAAAPKILGLLRKEMHKEVADRLIGEVPKALTGREVDDIQRVLSAHH
jgi:protein required for attachment to host cells